MTAYWAQTAHPTAAAEIKRMKWRAERQGEESGPLTASHGAAVTANLGQYIAYLNTSPLWYT